MRFEHLDLNLLTALDALLDARSVSAAARRLHMTQPGVTSALRRLRDYFGDELLVQSGRHMLLTARAESLQQPVRRILLQIRADIMTPHEFDPRTAQRQFSVVASDYVYDILFADVMADLASTAPGIRFRIVPPGNGAFELLERAEVDLLFTVVGSELRALPSQPLFRDEEVIICSRDAGFETCDLECFFSAGHVVAQFGSDHDISRPFETRSGVRRDRRIEVVVPTFAALPAAVVGTRRIATMHRLYADHFATRYPIAIHACPVPVSPITEIMQWHSVRGLDPALRWLMAQVEQRCRLLPPHARLVTSPAAGSRRRRRG